MTLVMGMDVGFRKTGITIFDIGGERDELIHAETVQSDNLEMVRKLDSDMSSVFSLLVAFDKILAEKCIHAVFAESPEGGSRGARASHCMGMAKALLAGFLHYNPEIEFEIFSPGQVEVALGIKLTPGEAKKLGMKKGERAKWKKERLRTCVLTEWPDFKGWPKAKAIAEDSYDSAAAFLCARTAGEIYRKLKEKECKIKR